MKFIQRSWRLGKKPLHLLLVGIMMFVLSASIFAQVAVSTDEYDSEYVGSEAEKFLGLFLNSTNETIQMNDELLGNGTVVFQDAVTVNYYWDGAYHVWERTVDTGFFYGEYVTKIQYMKNGVIVPGPVGADYMKSIETAKGHFGFLPADPTHGVKFENTLEIEWQGFNTANFVISAHGQFLEKNHAIHNGADVVLNNDVYINVDDLKLNSTRPGTISFEGCIIFDMVPWYTTICSDGSDIAEVKINKYGSLIYEYDLNLATLVGGVIPPVDMMDIVINADDEYKLWVNGAELVLGPGANVWNQADWYRVPVLPRPRWQHYEENVFGVYLNNRGNVGGLLMEAFVEGVPVFQTDESWVYSQTVDDGAWVFENFNDSGWEPVTVEGKYPDTAPWNSQIQGFPIPSNAHWINGSDDDGYFRAKFKIHETRPGSNPVPPPPPPPPAPGPAGVAVININGDDIYDLWLNGTYIGGSDKWNVAQNWPVTLMNGENKMEVLLTNRGNGGGLIAEVVVGNKGPVFWTQANDWKYNLSGFDAGVWYPVVDQGQYPFAQPWGSNIFYFPEQTPAHWIIAGEGDGDGYYMAKFNYNAVAKGIANSDLNTIPNEYALDQNYPNPFNPTTSITYRLPEASNVFLKIYDVTGREVRTLINNNQAAGAHTIQWDAKDEMGNKVNSGVYFYKIVAGSFTATNKMILMK
jgi:hypothetical protein